MIFRDIPEIKREQQNICEMSELYFGFGIAMNKSELTNREWRIWIFVFELLKGKWGFSVQPHNLIQH